MYSGNYIDTFTKGTPRMGQSILSRPSHSSKPKKVDEDDAAAKSAWRTDIVKTYTIVLILLAITLCMAGLITYYSQEIEKKLNAIFKDRDPITAVYPCSAVLLSFKIVISTPHGNEYKDFPTYLILLLLCTLAGSAIAAVCAFENSMLMVTVGLGITLLLCAVTMYMIVRFNLADFNICELDIPNIKSRFCNNIKEYNPFIFLLVILVSMLAIYLESYAPIIVLFSILGIIIFFFFCYFDNSFLNYENYNKNNFIGGRYTLPALNVYIDIIMIFVFVVLFVDEFLIIKEELTEEEILSVIQRILKILKGK